MGTGLIPFNYYIFSEVIEHLEFDQIGRLFDALLNYAKDNQSPDFGDDETLYSIWPLIRPT